MHLFHSARLSLKGVSLHHHGSSVLASDVELSTDNPTRTPYKAHQNIYSHLYTSKYPSCLNAMRYLQVNTKICIINSFSVLTELWSTVSPCFTKGFSMKPSFSWKYSHDYRASSSCWKQPYPIHSQKLSICNKKIKLPTKACKELKLKPKYARNLSIYRKAFFKNMDTMTSYE